MPTFIKSHDGLDIHYVYKQVKSSKPIILFLHGLGANYSEWKQTMALAKKKGYSTLAIDLRGHGLSSTPEQFEFYALEHFADDVKKIITHLKIKKLVLVGHSFGGSIAIVYCTKYLDSSLQRMILIESTHKYPYKKYHELNVNPIFCFLLRKLVQLNILTNKSFPKIPELNLIELYKENMFFQIYDELYHTPFKVIFQCLDKAKDFSTQKERKITSTLQSIQFPTLLITGTEDTIIDKEYSYKLKNLIPNSKLKVFEKASHQFPLEENHILNKELFSFLAEKN
ncbi:MAG: alpha/beta hydrolase [bacterium]|nr:alpha/beta hydrolase [bacterium]